MYHEYFQFKENPFNVTADPDFFFSSKCHQEAIANLTYGINQRKGIIVISGEIGTGKTTLCRKLLSQSDSKTKFALILNPSFSELQLLQLIIQDLGIRTASRSKYTLVQALNQFLLNSSNHGYNVVVVIDEAQNLSVSQLEQIRLLSNLETEKEKLLQIVLVGQPELSDKLHLPELRQIRQRIAIHYNINPLDIEDVQKYIQHRLMRAQQRAGKPQHVKFTQRAIERIHFYSHGIPRAINILCDRALLAGFAKNCREIDIGLIEVCAQEIMYCEHHL